MKKCVNSAFNICAYSSPCLFRKLTRPLRILLAYLTFEWEKSFPFFTGNGKYLRNQEHFKMSPQSHDRHPLRRNSFNNQLLVTQGTLWQYLFFDLAFRDQSDGRYSWLLTSDKDRITSCLARPSSGNPRLPFKASSLNFFPEESKWERLFILRNSRYLMFIQSVSSKFSGSNNCDIT